MKQLRRFFTSGLAVLVLYLVIILAILVVVETQPVQATRAPMPLTATMTRYADLTDAAPQRDITKQRFAPLEESK
jgi:hypothetical protein